MVSQFNFSHEFPVVEQYTYLNTASSGLLPKSLMEWRRQHDLVFLENGSIFRESHKAHLWNIKEDVARFFHTGKEQVALVPNFSFGMNIILDGLPKGSRILLVRGDYPSINWPVEYRDFEVCYAELDERLENNISEAFKKHRPDVFICSIVQYINGVLVDLEALKALKNQYPDTLFIADGTQYFGTARFHFEDSPFDAIGASAYKWMLAGYGNGFFLIKDRITKKVFPNTIGFNSMDAVMGNKDKINFIGRMEPGHQDTLNYGTLGEAIRFLEQIGMEKIEAYLQDLSQQVHAALTLKGLLPAGIAHRKKHSTIFNIKGDEVLFKRLRENGIICTLRGGGIRIGFHFYNTLEDVEKLMRWM